MRVLLVTPPMTQLNTPYPATAYLAGSLQAQQDVEVCQADLSIDLALKIFSADGLRELHGELIESGRSLSKPTVRFFVDNLDRYLATVGPVVRFLQGRDTSLAYRILDGRWLPRGSRFDRIPDPEGGAEGTLNWAFGSLGIKDRAQYLASLYIDDIADAIRDGIDEGFALARYHERLAASAASMDPLLQRLCGEPTCLDRWIDGLAETMLDRWCPDVVGISIPFPGNLYGGIRVARLAHQRGSRVVVGGGYVSTELRSVADPRFFQWVDHCVLDSGEEALRAVIEDVRAQRHSLPRVIKMASAFAPRPTYGNLDLSRYLAISEALNPMFRLWSSQRWNKLTLAHGCYWRRCSFCDLSLDYIQRYEEQRAESVVDQMDRLFAETGCGAFHFVDEAAPPKMLLAVARELLRRQRTYVWWGNVRFERSFSVSVCRTLADAGMVAVTGGLEVASDHLLKVMDKGVTVRQAARAGRNFAEAGMMVHAYLMYGFPGQTVQETVNALETVRQLFEEGCLVSAFWHRFVATIHSPMGQDPRRFGIRVAPVPEGAFAVNDLVHVEDVPVDHDSLGPGLEHAVYNFMLGLGLDRDVRRWFDRKVPRPTVRSDFVAQCLEDG